MKKFIFRVHILGFAMMFPCFRLFNLFILLARCGWRGLQCGLSSWRCSSGVLAAWALSFKLFKNGGWPDEPSTLERWVSRGPYDDKD